MILKRSYRPFIWIAGLACVSILLLHPGRFSENNVDTLSWEEMLENIQDNVEPSSSKSKCQLDSHKLLNWKASNISMVSYTKIDDMWTPQNCQPRFKTVIVVPYRNRKMHLDYFVPYMHSFLRAQNLSYSIYVIEQESGKPFNRGKLFNIGFMEANKHSNLCFVFHDVDLLPTNAQNLYVCSRHPTHLSGFVDTFRFNLPYHQLFGGAVAISEKTFKAVNGFSNEFFGWGGEDDDFWQNRVAPFTGNAMFRYDPSISKYQMLPHDLATPSEARYEMIEKGHQSAGEDGLSNIEYSVKTKTENELYSHLLVAI